MTKDTLLQQAVLAELSWEPSITAGHIGVTADNGVVTLSGHVDTFAEKRAAEAAASRVCGVKAVAENIKVQLPLAMKRGDDQIAAAILERFEWDVVVPKDQINVKVEDGQISLTGNVDWRFQSDAAEDACRRMSGVVSVFNQLEIKPRANADSIHYKIMLALRRTWFEPVEINVTADGGKVRLTGNVRTWHERQEAETAAWSAPGVTMVDDALVID